jgi:membrane-bound serine protease (ClpP class)
MSRDLFAQLDGREVVASTAASRRCIWPGQRSPPISAICVSVISAVADPNIALILIVIGALGIYVEFSSPGLIAPGVAGAISVLLGLSALSVLPINWAGVGC